MASKFQAPRGTFDVLPEQGRARALLQTVAALPAPNEREPTIDACVPRIGLIAPVLFGLG